jgi:hypothetical protein
LQDAAAASKGVGTSSKAKLEAVGAKAAAKGASKKKKDDDLASLLGEGLAKGKKK